MVDTHNYQTLFWSSEHNLLEILQRQLPCEIFQVADMSYSCVLQVQVAEGFLSTSQVLSPELAAGYLLAISPAHQWSQNESLVHILNRTICNVVKVKSKISKSNFRYLDVNPFLKCKMIKQFLKELVDLDDLNLVPEICIFMILSLWN